MSKRRPTSGFTVYGIYCAICDRELTGRLNPSAKKKSVEFLRAKKHSEHFKLLEDPRNFDLFWCFNEQCPNYRKYSRDHKILSKTTPEKKLERKKMRLAYLNSQVETLEKDLMKLREERDRLQKEIEFSVIGE